MPAQTKPTKATATIAVIGIDIGKNVFHPIGLDYQGAVVLKVKLSCGQLMPRLANLAPAAARV
jgi:transposase